MKNILVTGAAGFIGSNFVHHILDWHNVVCYDILMYAGSIVNLQDVREHPNYAFVHGDICDNAKLLSTLKQYNIDTVVHFAAESHVDRSILNPEHFVQNNIVGTHTLLEVCKSYWLDHGTNNPRFIYISTDEVFGDLQPDERGWTEESCHWPRTPYSATKSAGDAIVMSYFYTYNFPAITINAGNNYGPRQFPEKFVPMMIVNALNDKQLTLHGDGSHIRDWLYVGDMCDAVYELLLHGVIGEKYNVAGNIQITNRELLLQLCQILDTRHPNAYPFSDTIVYVDDRPNNDQRYDLNTDKIYSHIGWKPKMSLLDGLEKTVDWYLSNPDWIKEITYYMNTRNWKDWKSYRKF